MIHYSAYPDLYKVMDMFNEMTQEDKKFLFFDNQYFFIKLTELHYDLVKGRCIMLVNPEGKTIGFVSISLEHNEHLFITEMYICPKYRAGSMPVLLEMFAQLKLYMRPIEFVVHIENQRMHKIAEFIKAKKVATVNNNVKYVVQI
jgi:hypothetical protein